MGLEKGLKWDHGNVEFVDYGRLCLCKVGHENENEGEKGKEKGRKSLHSCFVCQRVSFWLVSEN